jgi:hypothetical protein
MNCNNIFSLEFSLVSLNEKFKLSIKHNFLNYFSRIIPMTSFESFSFF